MSVSESATATPAAWEPVTPMSSTVIPASSSLFLTSLICGNRFSSRTSGISVDENSSCVISHGCFSAAGSAASGATSSAGTPSSSRAGTPPSSPSPRTSCPTVSLVGDASRGDTSSAWSMRKDSSFASFVGLACRFAISPIQSSDLLITSFSMSMSPGSV